MNLASSILIYSVTITFSCFAFYVAGKGEYKLTRKIALFLAIMITVTVAGVRYGIGTDYFSYLRGFEQIKIGGNVRWAGLEYGYYLLNLVLAKIGFGGQSVLMVCSLIMMSFISRALMLKKEVLSVGMGALVFMLLFYQSSFNLIRLMLAVVISLYNISNIENRKFFKFLFFVLLAASFHISALGILPMFWLLPLKKGSWKKYIFFVGGCLLLIFFNPIFDWILSTVDFANADYYRQYIGISDKSVAIAIKRTLLYLPVVIPGFLMYEECHDDFDNFYIYYAMTVLGVIITALGTFQVIYVDRIAQYFLIASVIVIPVYMRVFWKNKYYLLMVATVAYLILLWLYIYFVVKDHGTVPYLWIFN